MWFLGSTVADFCRHLLQRTRRSKIMKHRSLYCALMLCLFLCGNVCADGLTVPVKDLNSVSTFEKIVRQSEKSFKYNIYSIDSHTGGEPTRVVMAGLPQIQGSTMIAQKKYFQEHLDFLRTALMNEPRGACGYAWRGDNRACKR